VKRNDEEGPVGGISEEGSVREESVRKDEERTVRRDQMMRKE
jgi:hypothetical protein